MYYGSSFIRRRIFAAIGYIRSGKECADQNLSFRQHSEYFPHRWRTIKLLTIELIARSAILSKEVLLWLISLEGGLTRTQPELGSSLYSTIIPSAREHSPFDYCEKLKR
jgi:hypothetical protein